MDTDREMTMNEPMETIWIEEADGEGYHLIPCLLKAVVYAVQAWTPTTVGIGDCEREAVAALMAAFPPPSLARRREHTLTKDCWCSPSVLHAWVE